jgi:glycosyltransferase involved in cell wall biosynthesis
MTKLSIITINRNNRSGLEKTIQSVADQTFEDFEFIIIDGDSDDGSKDVLRQSDGLITAWVSEPDTGIYNAMNKGIEKAMGEYCLFLNSGDILLHENALTQLFSHSFHEDIVYANQQRVGTDSTYIIEYPDKLSFFHFYAEYLGHNSTLIKRKLFSQIGLYNEENRIVSDWEFLMLAICKYNCSHRYLPLVFSVQYDGGISNSPSFREKVQVERKKTLEEHFPLFLEDYEQLFNQKYNSAYKKLKRKLRRFICR